jgi:hypothetical protein
LWSVDARRTGLPAALPQEAEKNYFLVFLPAAFLVDFLAGAFLVFLAAITINS